MNVPLLVECGGDSFELRVHCTLTATVTRALIGYTALDRYVDELQVPTCLTWRGTAIRCLRWYRCRIGSRLGNRCVWDPSCSRFAELAIREYGPVRATMLVLRRLRRCKPGGGGIDLPPQSEENTQCDT